MQCNKVRLCICKGKEGCVLRVGLPQHAVLPKHFNLCDYSPTEGC
jgi:hypothetical protein